MNVLVAHGHANGFLLDVDLTDGRLGMTWKIKADADRSPAGLDRLAAECKQAIHDGAAGFQDAGSAIPA